MLVTADHGNAEEMYTRKKGQVVRDAAGRPSPKTSHTLNPVPFVLLDSSGTRDVERGGIRGISSLGATILELCGLSAPEFYDPGLVHARAR
jgi:2,3-bisphosphoglycerate-independent phosphoglycerate mutase